MSPEQLGRWERSPKGKLRLGHPSEGHRGCGCCHTAVPALSHTQQSHGDESGLLSEQQVQKNQLGPIQGLCSPKSRRIPVGVHPKGGDCRAAKATVPPFVPFPSLSPSPLCPSPAAAPRAKGGAQAAAIWHFPAQFCSLDPPQVLWNQDLLRSCPVSS